MQNQAVPSNCWRGRRARLCPGSSTKTEQFPAVTGPGSTLLAGGSGVVPFFVNDKIVQSVGTPKFPALVLGSTLGPGENSRARKWSARTGPVENQVGKQECKAYVRIGADKIGYESGESE